jgi:hypothetical protein
MRDRVTQEEKEEHMTLRKWIVLTGLCLIPLASAAGAIAVTPVVVEKQQELTRVFAGLQDCQAYGYTFTTTGRFEVTRSITDFYANDGNLLREELHIRFVGSETNDVTGNSLPVNGVRHITLDFVRGTFTETGVLRHVAVPGEGIVLHESGRLVRSLDDDQVLGEAGPHQLFQGDLAAFCAALATP